MEDRFLNYLSLVEDEMLSSRVLPKDKEIKFEYYKSKNEDGKDYIKSVEITIENQKQDFPVPTLKPKSSDAIKRMAYHGFYIVKSLGLHHIKRGPADIVVKNSDIISISGYTLKNKFSINQVDKNFVEDLKKQGIISEIKKNMILEK